MSDKGEVRIELDMKVHVQPRNKTEGGRTVCLDTLDPVGLSVSYTLTPDEALALDEDALCAKLRALMSGRFAKRVRGTVQEAAHAAMPTEPHTAELSWQETAIYSATVQVDVPLGADAEEFVKSHILDDGDDSWLSLVSAQTKGKCLCSNLDDVEDRQVLSIDNVKKQDKQTQ